MDLILFLAHPLLVVCTLLLYMLLRLRRRASWHAGQCPVDLSGKTAIVTGANCGIGRYVAQDLARRNARVILACRSRERGQKALVEIQRETGNHNVLLRIVDTSSMVSVREFAEQILQEEKHLDILVNNAGASGLPKCVTSEGLELVFATNHLGPFLLTNLLLDLIKQSPGGRIVNVSSFMHAHGKVNLKHLKGKDLQMVSKNSLYNSSKLMNILFSNELAQRLHSTGDSGYPLLCWLLTPLCHPHSAPERRFNRCHVTTRNTIERTFGLLKAQLRCLHQTGGARLYAPAFCAKIVTACAILHNICLLRNIPLPVGEEPGPDSEGVTVTVNAVDPGFVRTEVMRHYNWIFRFLFQVLCLLFFKSAEEGASSTIYCAVSEDVAGITGKYFSSDCSLALASSQARDTTLAAKLWEECEALTGLRNAKDKKM